MILSSLDFGNQTYINSFYHFFSHKFFSVKIYKNYQNSNDLFSKRPQR